MILPKSIRLAGFEVKIIQDETFEANSGKVGYCCYKTQTIVIDPSFGSEEAVKQILLHEIVHWILFVMGEQELRNNERFVDMFANFLHQSIGDQLWNDELMIVDENCFKEFIPTYPFQVVRRKE